MWLGQWLEVKEVEVRLGVKGPSVNAGFQKTGSKHSSQISAWCLHITQALFQHRLLLILASPSTAPGSSPPLPWSYFPSWHLSQQGVIICSLSTCLLSNIFLRHTAGPTNAIHESTCFLNVFLCGETYI